MSKPVTKTTSYTGATLGLRLGLMVSFLALGIPPLIRFYVSYRLNAGTDDVLYQLPFDLLTILNGLTAVVVMITIVLAWRGRPPQVRWLLQIVFVVALVVIAVEAYVRYNAECTENCLIAASDDIFNLVFRYMIPIQLLSVIYTIWYINRQPAREFYEQFME